MAEDGSVEGVNWNPRALTKVLIHGLTSTYWLSPIRNIWSQHIFDIKDGKRQQKLSKRRSKLCSILCEFNNEFISSQLT